MDTHTTTTTHVCTHTHTRLALSTRRESSSVIKVHRGFKEALTIRVPFSAEGIFGGALLGVRSADFICFYDWSTGRVSALLKLL